MAKAMKAIKAMKARRPLRAPPATVSSIVALITQLSLQKVDRVIDDLFAVACAELKKNGKCNFINMVRLVLKPSAAAREGINPFTKKPCFFKPKPLQVSCFALRKFKLRLADELECCWLR